MIQFNLISIMPALVEALKHGMIQKALLKHWVEISCFNPRDWAAPPQCQVDDTPYGGGAGMVLQYEPFDKAIRFAKKNMPKKTKTIYLSPEGKVIRQHDLNEVIRQRQSLLFITGRYEGIDERIVETHADETWSIGDFVLSGGELAAMTFIDALVRLIPGVLGDPASASEDAFMQGLLDYPHYTKPACVDGKSVPEVLLSGDHQAIRQWRLKQSLGRTWLKRPDLLQLHTLTKSEETLLSDFKGEHHEHH